MPIENNFLHFNNDTTFQSQKSQIKDDSITFVKDSGKIYTHKKEYPTVNWASALASGSMLQNFIVSETEGAFQTKLDSGEILSDAIAFMVDTKRIWTHNNWFATQLTAEEIRQIIEDSPTLEEFLKTLSPAEVAISDTEPTNNEKIWIDTSEDPIDTLSIVEEAPKDGKAYIRKDGKWIQHQEQEVYVGTEEPSEDLDCDIWLNPETGEIHYKNSESNSWEVIEGGGGIGEITETVKVTLTSNQTNPNSDLTGTKVTVTYSENITREQEWQGSELTFNIPTGQEYTVSVEEITDYAKPEDQSYTAVAGNTKNLTFTYNTTVVSVTVSGVTSATATVTGSSTSNLTFSAGALTQTFRVPTGQAYTVTFSEVTGYATPAQISTTAAGATQSHNADYSNTTVTVTVASNQSDFNGSVTATISYSGGTDNKSVTGTGQLQFSVPYGVSYTIIFNEISPFRTPTQISDSANASTKSHSVSYDATDVTISLTSNHGTTDLGNARVTIGGTQYSNGQVVRVATGSTVSATFSSVTGYSTPSAQSPTATGATMTITGTYQSEWVTINVTGVSSGFTVSITGGFTATQTATSQQHKIPYGTSYTVSAGNVNGYTAPSNQQFTANQNTRTVTVAYTEITNGVFIYDNQGNLTPVSSWNAGNNSKALGVAVITEDCEFVISKSLPMKNAIEWGGYGTDISELTNYSSSSSARNDFNGQSNTSTILLNLGTSTDIAAGYCRSQSLNGKTGYLPAAGELYVMWENKSDINSALQKIGASTIDSAFNNLYTGSHYPWSSTEYSSYNAWYLIWENSSSPLSHDYKSGGHSYSYAFPVFPLK